MLAGWTFTDDNESKNEPISSDPLPPIPPEGAFVDGTLKLFKSERKLLLLEPVLGAVADGEDDPKELESI